MQLCPNCGHQNRTGVVFCDNCGVNLLGIPLSTKSLDPSRPRTVPSGIESSVLLDVKIQGAEQFDPDDTLRLEIDGSPEPIRINPKPETIFGRRDPATGAMPDIDLTPYSGYRMGVSRRHSAIRHGDDRTLDLWDLGSSNGTFLNGQRLSSHRPYRLRDGDEIRLGQLVIRVYFDQTRKSAVQPAHVPEVPAPHNGPKSSPGSAGGSPSQPTGPVSSIRKDTGTLLRPPSGPRPVDSVPFGRRLDRLPRTGTLPARPSSQSAPGAKPDPAPQRQGNASDTDRRR